MPTQSSMVIRTNLQQVEPDRRAMGASFSERFGVPDDRIGMVKNLDKRYYGVRSTRPGPHPAWPVG